MRILQVIPRFNPKLGGGVDVVYNLSRYMVRRGHEATVITTDYEFDEGCARDIQTEGVEVLPFRHIFNLCLFIPSPGMKNWLSRNIESYDVVHLNGARAYQNNIVYEYARRHGVPYVLQAHGSVLRIIERQRLKKMYDLLWGYRILRGATKVIALTHSEGESYKAMGVNKDRIEILPNGVDLAKFDDLPSIGEFRKEYSIPDNERIVLYLGRLHASKGIGLLIEAFSELTADLDNVKLVLVGPDGGLRRTLEKRAHELGIGDKIMFTGLVPEETKIMAFVDADVFVTPRFYGFPITFLEAMVCGAPVITTNAGDFIEGIDGEIGFVVGYDREELKNALSRILVNDELRKKFKERSKEKSITYDWALITEKLEKVYEECMRERT